MTLAEAAQVLRKANPSNKPMCLEWIARQLYPDADYHNRRSTHGGGGARVGALVAAGICGKMAKRGLLKRDHQLSPTIYYLKDTG